MRAIVTLSAFPLAAALGLFFGAGLFGPVDLVAQQGPGTSLANQSMRPYAHVFWAYGLAWLIILGWIISIARRWSRVERELGGETSGSSGGS